MSSALPAREANQKIDRLEREKKNAKADAEQAKGQMQTLLAFGATRFATNVIDSVIPQFAGLKPVAEIGGALYSGYKAFDDDTEEPGLYLGAAMGLGVGIVDRMSAFAVDTFDKFKNKAK